MRGEAELRILNFKTTWSEFQKPSQTAAERGEAELRILNFKTTWSEFQRPSQTAPADVKPRCVYRKYANNNRGYYCFQPPFSFWGRLQFEGGYNYKKFSNFDTSESFFKSF